MTVPRWDAKTASRRFPGEPARHPGEPARTVRPGPKRKMLLAGLAAFVAVAATVGATQAIDGEERIGVCHATGSAENPYVFQVVNEDGFEHGHHRHHEDDFFVTDLGRGCVSDDLVVAPAPGNGTEPAGNASEEPVAETPEQPAGNETPASEEPAAEEPAEEPAPEGTETPTQNETEGDGNVTPPQPPAGDAAVRQSAAQDDFAVTLTLRVTSIGPGVAEDVVLEDQLPDVRRSWSLTGADAEAFCVLDGRSLSCWFGDLAPGEERIVVLGSFTDRMPCGFALTNTAFVSSVADAEARNDASSASITARSC
jgi:hypothetical protein